MSDLTWTPVRVRLGQIKPWTHNPRMSTKAQAQRLIKSERELGQPQTLAVSPFDNGFVDLYDGHQRVAAWNTIKGADFEVWALQSNRPLDDDERRKISILLHTATGSWEWDKLAAWSAADLQEWGFDRETLQAWNNDANNLREMFQSEEQIDPMQEWVGMPEYNSGEAKAYKSLNVHFQIKPDYDEFIEFIKDKIEQQITDKTKSIWFPRKPESQNGLIFENES